MALRWAQKLLLAKIETTAGTDAVPTASADAILASNVEVTPVAGDAVNRELERPYYGGQPDINVNTHTQISFGVELARDLNSSSAEVAETVPRWAALLEACGMKPGASSNDHVYSPITGSEKTLTIWINIAGVVQKIVGCRGTFSLELGVGAIPRVNFTFTGRYGDPSDLALPAATYPKSKLVIPANDVTTVALAGGLAYNTGKPALSALTLDWGAEVVFSERIGVSPSAQIVNRASNGRLTLDAPKVAGEPLVKHAKEGVTGSLTLKHGVASSNQADVDGRTIEIAMPAISLSSPSYQEANGVWQIQANYAALPNAAAGNDEVKITFH